jgi:outer membrane protein assembly factor BamB
MKHIFTILLLSSFLAANAQKVTDLFKEEWKTKIGITTFRTNMIFENGKIYIASNGEERSKVNDSQDGVYIIDGHTGNVSKQINVEGERDEDANGVAVVGDRIYFGNDDNKFYCYNSAGEEMWTYEIEANEGSNELTLGDVESVPALLKINGDDNIDLVFTVEGYGVIALDGKTGMRIWDFEFKSHTGTYMNSPAVYDLNGDGTKDVIFGGKRDLDPEIRYDYRNAVYALNGKNGEIIWQWSTGSNVHASPMVIETKDKTYIMVAESYSRLTLLDTKGKKVRQHTLQNPDGGISGLFSSPVISNAGMVVIGTSWWGEKDGVWVVDVFNQNDKENKAYKTCNRVSSSAVVADLVPQTKGIEILICTEDGHFMMYNQSGRLLRKLKLPAGVEATPLVADIDGDKLLEIVVASLDGYLYCYQTDSKGKVHWGQFRGNNENTGVLKIKKFE